MQVLRFEKDWLIDKDENNCGESLGWNKEISPTAISAFVPSIIQQFLPEYHGVAFYWKKFNADFSCSDTDRILLNFGGVDYKAEVWLNGIKLGSHEGGEEPFSFDITSVIKFNNENLLAVRVVNPTDKIIDGFTLYETPHRNKITKKGAGSNLNHGGIWYNVDVSIVPAICIDDVFITGDIDSGIMQIDLDLFSCAKDSANVDVDITVLDKKGGNVVVFNDVYRIKNAQNRTSKQFKVKIQEHKLWSVDEPNLYSVRITIKSKYGTDEKVNNFGFRHFCIKDGYFTLNGKKLFLCSSHTGNAFPIGQMIPTKVEQTNKDMLYAKSCGFNMIRSIAGQLRPEQLDFADEIGLLVYEECLASWCMLYSQWVVWTDENDYQALRKRREDLLLPQNTQPVYERWENATSAMIKRDRNHPSIVAWGLLNETKYNGIFLTAVNYLPKLRKLDESRLVFLNSQRTDYRFEYGSASNPYSNKWDNVLGNDGIEEDSIIQEPGQEKHFCDEGGFIGPSPRAGDTHVYGNFPFGKNYVATIRSLGFDTPLPVFLSETGVGSLFNVTEEYKHFVQHGQREDLEDASWLKAQSDSLQKDWERLNLYRVYPFIDDFLKESQRINAQDRYRFFNVVRSNPRICGYSLTGLLDHGMCGEGLWSYWRKMKKDMFDAVSDGWSKLRFCLFATEHGYSGEEIELECVLANSGILESGEYTADFAIVGQNGTVMTFSHTFMLDKNDFATPVFKKKVVLNVPTGKYTLTARLDKGAPCGDKLFFYITNKKDLPIINDTVYVKGLNDDNVATLSAHGLKVVQYNGQTDGIVLLGNVELSDVKRAINSAKAGAKIAFVYHKPFFNEGVMQALEFSDDLSICNKRDWLYHKEYVTTPDTIFDGLNIGIVDSVRYGQIFPHKVFVTKKTPPYVISPGFITGYHDEPTAYGQYWASFAYDIEKGKVLLSTFNVEDNAFHPVSVRLLLNIINYLKNDKTKL